MAKFVQVNNKSTDVYVNADNVIQVYGVGCKSMIVMSSGEKITANGNAAEVVKMLSSSEPVKVVKQEPLAKEAEIPAKKLNINTETGSISEFDDEGPNSLQGAGVVTAAIVLKKIDEVTAAGGSKEDIIEAVHEDFGIELKKYMTIKQMQEAVTKQLS